MRQGCDSSRPYGPREFAGAKRWLDHDNWIPWKRIRRVLCLAAAGGQQSVLFAALGYEVVSVDLSPEQLELDRRAANERALRIECIEADMLDLSCVHGRTFDLVYQAVSACYVPDVRRLYGEVAKVLRPGGYYRVEHWNPYQIQLSQNRRWNGAAYQLARPQTAGRPVPWSAGADANGPRCWHFIHSLEELIGGLCDAGFSLVRFAERGRGKNGAGPGSDEHLATFIPPFFSMLARRRQPPKRTDRRRAVGDGEPHAD